MDASTDNQREPISTRVSKLNQLFLGRSSLVAHKSLVCREGLLDALFVLYDECNSEQMMKNRHISSFVLKYAETMSRLRGLRLSIKDFEVKDIIGQGHFGEVQLVREKQNGNVYALKVLSKAETLSQQSVAFYEEERDIMAKANSPWITQLQYAFQDRLNLYLVMEFHPGGDLLSLLSRYDDCFEESMAKFYLAEMVMAIHALHNMGYVHRDIKPENILIDRTGHIKLADFGSATKLADESSSVSNMPVGTPDYICPEVLIRMNNTQATGKFGEECDWWSLGICAYEMLYGKTPFTDENGSMVVTYANIMNFKKCLKFPRDSEVSGDSIDMIERLLTEACDRLNYQGLCQHKFFADVDFNNIRHTTPPFIPTVTSKDDTSNFDEFEKKKHAPHLEDLKKKKGEFSGQDLPFIGFTFTKNLNTLESSGLSRKPSVIELSAPTTNSKMERKLTMKSKELSDVREKFLQLENREYSLQSKVEKLERQLQDKDEALRKAEAERNDIERGVAQYIAKVNSLERLVEIEKAEKIEFDNQAAQLLEDIRLQADQVQKLRDEQNKNECERQEKEIALLEEEKKGFHLKIDKLEKELKKSRKENEETESQLTDARLKLAEVKESARQSVEDLMRDLEEQQQASTQRQDALQNKLTQAMQQNVEMTEVLEKVRQAKNELEEEIYDMKMKRFGDQNLRKRLSDSEEKRRSLESQVSKMLLMEKREEQLKKQLEEKSQHVTQLAERIGDLEEQLKESELEYKKCENIYAQKEYQLNVKIKDLKDQLEDSRSDRSKLEEDSLIFFEENEERLRKIQEQEGTIKALKSNVKLLEKQLSSMKEDVKGNNKAEVRTAQTSPMKNVPWSVTMETTFSQTSPMTLTVKAKAPHKSAACQTSPKKTPAKTSTPTHEHSQGVQKVKMQTAFYSTPKTGLVTKHQLRAVHCQTTPGVDETVKCSHNPHPQAGTIKKHQLRAVHSQTSPLIFRADDSVSQASCSSQTSPVSVSGMSVQTSPCVTDGHNEAFIMTDSSIESTTESSQTDSSVQTSPWRNTSDYGSAPQSGYSDATCGNSASPTRSVPESTNSVSSSSSQTSPISVVSTKSQTNAMETVSEVCQTSFVEKAVSQICQTSFIETATIELGKKSRESMEQSGEKEGIRRRSEKISDLEQEKMYLESRIEQLETEVSQFRDATHQQRIRALDLKHELKEKTVNLEVEVGELKEKLSEAEVKTSEATEESNQLREKEAMLRTKLTKIQQDFDSHRLESNRTKSKLQEERDDFEKQLTSIQSKCKALENVESDMKQSTQKLEAEVQELSRKCAELAPKNRDLEEKLQCALQDKNRFKMAADRARDELAERQRSHDIMEERVRQLKMLCAELESQVQDFEALNQNYEQKEEQWQKDKQVYEKAVDEREDQCHDVHHQLQAEKNARQKADEHRKEANKLLQSTHDKYRVEISTLQLQLHQQRDKAQHLNQQLTELEKTHSMLDVDYKAQQRRLEAQGEEIVDLKEEISKLITLTDELKTTNFKLSGMLEEAMDKYELLTNHKQDLENEIETLCSDNDQHVYKMESTIGQQSKLIDYLQTKVEGPPKKKKGLFGGTRRQQDLAGTPMATTQLREVQHALDCEREKVATLKRQMAKIKEELHQAKTENLRSKYRGGGGDGDLETPVKSAAVSALVMSPSTQPSPSVLLAPSRYHENAMTPKSILKPRKERMHHNIPHRFITGLNSRATKCAVCLGSVHFVRHAAKCQECQVVCHPKCAPSLPASCGLPTQYVQHFTEMIQKNLGGSTTSLDSWNSSLKMETWMKVPKAGKQVWEKKWVELEDNKLFIYDQNVMDKKLSEEFDLCPDNGDVTIQSAVTAAELTNSASLDLPYILRLDFDPHTTCWPGRSLYLMALNFPEKQHWVATLEAIVSHRAQQDKRKDAKLIGNIIVTLTGDQKLEVNCMMALNDQIMLLGTEEGLYTMGVSDNPNHRPLVHVEGLPSVYQIEKIPSLQQVALIADQKDRRLALVDTKDLLVQLSRPCAVQPEYIEGATACTTFTYSVAHDGLYLCVATAESIFIYKYNQTLRCFATKKELLTPQACSCLYFGTRAIIIGTDKFYTIDLFNLEMKELLNKLDSSLAFAAFGAVHYDSFPIAVLKVSAAEDVEEFLLCFHEFGVFVNELGQRTRQQDMKWSGLPLSFAYQMPYLYITHFNTMQIIEILPGHSGQAQGAKTFLNVASPRYLGPALRPGAVYIATTHDHVTEILCIRGNMVTQLYREESKENVSLMSSNRSTGRSPNKRKIELGACEDEAALRVSPSKSPPAIQRLSSSPKRMQVLREIVTTTSSSETSDSDSSWAPGASARNPILQKRVKFAKSTDSDTSF